MNIKDAKEQVKNTVTAYLTKNKFGEYRIPVNRQRPLFLVGAPGIGKTDIIAQVASEMGISLVSYSMTHHTRQSAIGLPFIKNQVYGNVEYRTTEYTMSEIIASVYDAMESSGINEGILFLDEINCISETLAPSMLQFLQTKKFGKHKIPDGWVIVTAGNPPEYNFSVREFDLATMDRLKEISVTPDYDVWREYAVEIGVHGAVITYLDVHNKDFYSVNTTIDRREFVTARGWVDLSEMMYIYEDAELSIDFKLITQYIHNERIARDFSAFYDLFFKYQKEYRIKEILDGADFSDILPKAKKSRFDERLIVVQQFVDALAAELENVYYTSSGLTELYSVIKSNKDNLSGDIDVAITTLRDIKLQKLKVLSSGKKNGNLSNSSISLAMNLDSLIHDLIQYLENNSESNLKSDLLIRDYISPIKEQLREDVSHANSSLKNAFSYIEQAYSGERELLLFVTHLSKNRYCADYILNHGSDEYLKYSRLLRIDKREEEIAKAAQAMGM